MILNCATLKLLIADLYKNTPLGTDSEIDILRFIKHLLINILLDLPHWTHSFFSSTFSFVFALRFSLSLKCTNSTVFPFGWNSWVLLLLLLLFYKSLFLLKPHILSNKVWPSTMRVICSSFWQMIFHKSEQKYTYLLQNLIPFKSNDFWHTVRRKLCGTCSFSSLIWINYVLQIELFSCLLKTIQTLSLTFHYSYHARILIDRSR